MSTIYIDIETLPTKRQDIRNEIASNIKAPGNYKSESAIKGWFTENFENECDKKLRETALNGTFGELFSIAWAIDDADPHVLSTADFTEKELLQAFYQQISNLSDKYGNRAEISKWVGHYITGFDLRFIWQRSVINGVMPLVNIPYDAKPWDSKVFDTKIAWTGLSSNGGGKLDDICKALGIEGKGEITGANVYDYWLAGKFSEIEEYNKQDVRLVREVYKRMTFLNHEHI